MHKSTSVSFHSLLFVFFSNSTSVCVGFLFLFLCQFSFVVIIKTFLKPISNVIQKVIHICMSLKRWLEDFATRTNENHFLATFFRLPEFDYFFRRILLYTSHWQDHKYKHPESQTPTWVSPTFHRPDPTQSEIKNRISIIKTETKCWGQDGSRWYRNGIGLRRSQDGFGMGSGRGGSRWYRNKIGVETGSRRYRNGIGVKSPSEWSGDRDRIG